MGRESTLWLVEQGIKVIGIDAFGFDRPFASMAEDFRRTGDGRYIWPAHFAGITRSYCQIEKLANLGPDRPFARLPRRGVPGQDPRCERGLRARRRVRRGRVVGARPALALKFPFVVPQETSFISGRAPGDSEVLER